MASRLRTQGWGIVRFDAVRRAFRSFRQGNRLHHVFGFPVCPIHTELPPRLSAPGAPDLYVNPLSHLGLGSTAE